MKKILWCFLYAGNVWGAVDVKHSCSGDVLDEAHAKGRVEWSIKAADAHLVQEYDKVIKNNALEIPGSWIQKNSQGNMSHPNVLGRRLIYPTFAFLKENLFENPLNWRAPVVSTAPLTIPQGYMIYAYCTADAFYYKPEMKVLVESGYLDVQTLHGLHEVHSSKKVMVLEDSSTLENLSFKSVDILSTKSVKDYEGEMIYLKMSSGTELRVTSLLSFLNPQGVLRYASEYKKGDKIMMISGKADTILSTETKKWKGHVFNFTPVGESPRSQMISVEGYLTGTLSDQSKDMKDLNRYVLRSHISL